MVPTTERRPPHPRYSLGDVGKFEHMVAFRTLDDNLSAAARLRPDDPCFVVRTGGRFTFARVLLVRHTRSGAGAGAGGAALSSDARIEVQVTPEGATKVVPMHLSPKYLRLMKPQGRAPSSQPSPRTHPEPRAQPAHGGGPSEAATSERHRRRLHKSCQSGLGAGVPAPPRRGIRRQASVKADFYAPKPKPRREEPNPPEKTASERRRRRLHKSCQSGLDAPGLRAAPRRGLHRQSSVHENFQCSSNAASQRRHRRGSSFVETPSNKDPQLASSFGTHPDEEKHARGVRRHASFGYGPASASPAEEGGDASPSSSEDILRTSATSPRVPEDEHRASWSTANSAYELSSAESDSDESDGSSLEDSPRPSKPEEGPRAKRLTKRTMKVPTPRRDDAREKAKEKSLLAAFGTISKGWTEVD